MNVMETTSTDDAGHSADENGFATAAMSGALVTTAENTAAAEEAENTMRYVEEYSGTASALLHAILRLETVIDEEIVALQSRSRVDYDGFYRRKNRGLLELVRSSKNATQATQDPLIAEEIERLRAKLVKNLALLRLHFDAVRSVADIICKSFRDAESDGTYTAISRARK
jgi:hypothetical protein